MATVTFIAGVMPAKIFIQRMFIEGKKSSDSSVSTFSLNAECMFLLLQHLYLPGFPSVTIVLLVAYYLFLQTCMEGHRRRHERQRTEKLKKA